MTQNPNYYNLHNVSHQHLSDHLSELVENTLQELVNLKCISIEDEMDVSALNLGYSTGMVEVYTLSLKERTKLKGLLEVVASSAEFESIPIRRHEDTILRRIYDRVPVKLDRADFKAPHFKTFLLLQAHFSRIQLPPDLAADQVLVLEKVLNLCGCHILKRMAECTGSNGCAADVCVGAVGDRQTDSPLKKIPHFEPEIIKRCKDAGIESVYDVMEMEDDRRNELLQMDGRQMRDIGFVYAQ